MEVGPTVWEWRGECKANPVQVMSEGTERERERHTQTDRDRERMGPARSRHGTGGGDDGPTV